MKKKRPKIVWTNWKSLSTSFISLSSLLYLLLSRIILIILGGLFAKKLVLETNHKFWLWRIFFFKINTIFCCQMNLLLGYHRQSFQMSVLVQRDESKSIMSKKYWWIKILPRAASIIAKHNLCLSHSQSATQFYLLFCSQYYTQCSATQSWESARSQGHIVHVTLWIKYKAMISSQDKTFWPWLLVSSRFLFSSFFQSYFSNYKHWRCRGLKTFIFYFDFGR